VLLEKHVFLDLMLPNLLPEVPNLLPERVEKGISRVEWILEYFQTSFE